MAIQLTKEGGLLKVVNSLVTEPKYIPFDDLTIKVSGDLMEINDGNAIDWNDVTVPTVTSAEDLADQVSAMSAAPAGGGESLQQTMDIGSTSSVAGEVNIASSGGNVIIKHDNGAGTINQVSTTTSSLAFSTTAGAGALAMTLSPTAGGFIVDSALSRGLKYILDYSVNGIANYGDRWIPDYGAVKAYADNAISLQSSIDGGATYSGGATIDVDTSDQLLLKSTDDGLAVGYIDLFGLTTSAEIGVIDSGGATVQKIAMDLAAMTVTDSTNTKGFVYGGDYSTAGILDDRWIPDYAAVKAFVNNAIPYKVYRALISQTGTSAPTVTVLENTLGFTPTWQYWSVGYYGIQHPDIVQAKTMLYLQPQLQNLARKGQDQIFYDGSDGGGGYISVQSTDENFSVLDGRLDNQSIEIKIYP